MSRLFAALAVLGTVFILALPAPASAAEKPDGVRNADFSNYEMSSHRRWRHRRYHRPYAYWGGRPHYGYYRPYYRPYYYRPYPYYGYYRRPGFTFWW